MPQGNFRTGRTKGYRNQKGGAHQLSRAEDPLIRDRMALVRRLKAQEYTAVLMVPLVSQFMRDRGQPEISVDTVENDIKAIRKEDAARYEKEAVELIADRVDALQEVNREAWKAFHTTADKSLNRGTYLNTIRQAEMDIAKLHGVTGPDVVVRNTVNNIAIGNDAVEAMIGALERAVGSENALRVIEAVAGSLEGGGETAEGAA